MLKRLLALSLSMVMILCCCACANNLPQDTTATTTTLNEDVNDNPSSELNAPENGGEIISSQAVATEPKKETTTPQPNVTPTQPQIKETEPKVTQSHVHSYSAATCTAAKTCSCGAVEGAPLGHSYSSATCTSPKTCKYCGITSGSSLSHSYNSATCTSAKTCKYCGRTSGSALGHSYSNGKCSRCGKTDPDSLPVALNKLPLLDYYNSYASRYKYETGAATDSFGNTYIGYHYFPGWPDSYAVFNLEGKYSTLSLDIIALSSMNSWSNAVIGIYVDDVLQYSASNFTTTTGKTHVDIDVKYGERLEIKVSNVSSGTARIGIVNAQVKK